MAMPMATLAAVAIAHALAAGVLVTIGFHSGCHLNPVVTVGLMVRGHITKLRVVLYVATQLLVSSLACILLRYNPKWRSTTWIQRWRRGFWRGSAATLDGLIGPMDGLNGPIITCPLW